MAFFNLNTNPKNMRVGDCVIRALSIATDKTWERVYCELAVYGFMLCDMPSSNAVWGAYLKDLGYERHTVIDTCPDDCYTIRNFCHDNPLGVFVIGTGTHAVAVIDGNYYDTWDSGDEVPAYAWKRGIKNDLSV